MSTGFPEHPPQGFGQNGAPPRRSRPWLPWVIVAVIVVVVASVVTFFAVSGGGDSEETPTAAPSTSQTSRPQVSATVTKPDNLELCAETANSTELCFPGMTLDTARQALEAISANCAPGGGVDTQMECEFSRIGLEGKVSFSTSSIAENKIEHFRITGLSHGSGSFPEGEQQSVERLKTTIAKVLPALVTQPPELVGQISDWANQNIGKCTTSVSDYALVGGYALQCKNPEGIGVPRPTGPTTTWTTSLTVDAGSGKRTFGGR